MKKFYLAGIIALAAVFTSCSVQAAGMKIGTVDFEKVFSQYNKTKTEFEKLQQDETSKEEQSKTMVAEINKLKDEADLLADGKEKEEKNELIKFKIKEFREFTQQARAAVLKARNDIGKELFDEIKVKVEAYAAKEKYDLILNTKSLVYSSADYDITDKVIEIINKD